MEASFWSAGVTRDEPHDRRYQDALACDLPAIDALYVVLVRDTSVGAFGESLEGAR